MVHKQVVVMQLQRDPASEDVVLNPYVKLLTDSLPGDRIRTRWFRWSGVLTDSFDVLHVHWPEFYIRHHTRVGHILKSGMFAILLARVRIGRKPVVRTVHNLRPHEDGSKIERWLLKWLDSMTATWIVMNESTPTPDPRRAVLIPHGHYRGWYQVPENVRQVSGSILTFGRVRAYKGIDELISSFVSTEKSQHLRLKVLGKPDGDDSAQTIRSIAGDDERIDLDFRFVPDDELAAAITACELVVLPYRDILNSGSALLALSLNRPLLMRDMPSTRLLRDEFGDEWVHLFEGELKPTDITSAIARIKTEEDVREVDMSRREWNKIGDQLASTYERSLDYSHSGRY